MLSTLRRIEIELHSYCNRKCSWCPNNKIDRSFYQEMPEETFLKIMYELKDNNFAKFRKGQYQETCIITFNRFCEPMSNIELLKKRVKQAREILPYAIYAINTNGDYLSKENIDDLLIDSIHIMDYDCKGRDHGLEVLKENNMLYFKESKEKGWLYAIHKTIGRVIYCYDWPRLTEIEDRAGSITNIHYSKCDVKWKNDRLIRTVPCIEPTYYLSIDYAGNVTPCCHIRADYNEHKDFVMGNVNIQSLPNILNSNKWVVFKDTMSNEDYTKYPEVCKTCNKTRKTIVRGTIEEDIYT